MHFFKHRSLAFTVLIFAVFSASLALAQAAFNRNLTVGYYGDDVLALQQRLNQSSITQLASNGPGSPGQETRYFGPLTRQAVIKFQDLYKSEVLTPLGLSRGTGYFGPSTRKKLNEGDMGSKTPTQPTAQTEITVVRIEPASSPPGRAVALYGQGFTGEETITIGGQEAVVSPRSSGVSTILFYIPDLTPGKHSVVVKRGDKVSIPLTYLVTSATSTVHPIISGLSPTSGRLGTILTINGSGFDLTSNTIYLGYDTISNVASKDGNTLIISILPDTQPFVGNEDGKITFPFWVYVENSNGVSNYKIFNFIP